MMIKLLLPFVLLLSLTQAALAQNDIQKAIAAASKPTVAGWRTPETTEAVALYIKRKTDAAYAKFREATAAGDADAYYFLGRMHHHGELRTPPEHIDTAQLRLEQEQLAKLEKTILGDTIELRNPEIFFYADRDSALYYYELALKGESNLAYLGMAELMTLRRVQDEKDFRENMLKAVGDIRERSIDGDAFSCRIMGSMHYTGYGAWRDRELAMRYFERAAQNGDIVTFGYIGSMYMDGEGVQQDKEKAFQWFKKGAEAGDREAYYSLGLYYEEGMDKPDLEQARKWYKLAMDKGSQNGYEQLKYLGMAPDTKLVIGAMERNVHVVTRALEQNANINTGENPFGYDIDFKGRTPLMHAVYLPHLLDGYGTVYDPDKRMQTVGLLLRRGAAINHTDGYKRSALHYAVSGTRVAIETFEQEQLQLLDTLLHYGADVNQLDEKNNSPLHSAMEHNKGAGLRDVERLIKAGAELNVQNNEGKTPLMIACDKNYSNETILVLITAGADATLLDKNGFAAIDYARTENARNMLLAAGSPEAKVPLRPKVTESVADDE